MNEDIFNIPPPYPRRWAYEGEEQGVDPKNMHRVGETVTTLNATRVDVMLMTDGATGEPCIGIQFFVGPVVLPAVSVSPAGTRTLMTRLAEMLAEAEARLRRN